MSRDKRILLILTPGFAAGESDTTCIPLQQSLVPALQKADPGLGIMILAFQYPYHQQAYRWRNVQVIPFNGRNKGGLSRLWLRKKISNFLEGIRRDYDITGLLSFWYGECALAGKKFADRYGLRHYCWLQGQDARKENKYPRLLPPRAGELIALSDFLQETFEKNHGIRPAHLIPPGVDPAEFSVLNPERDIDIIGAGSLIPLKRFHLFIQTVAAVQKKIPGLKAVLTGDGPERKSLEQEVRSLGLSETIRFTGELPHPELMKLMQSARILLHPSAYEGFGLVCLEALAAGAQVCSLVQPMHRSIENWRIAKNEAELAETITETLKRNVPDHPPVIPFPIDASAEKILQLFSA